MKIRPSSLPHLEACPRWVSRPDDPERAKSATDEAADEGTLVHAFMERLAGLPVSEWEKTIQTDPNLDEDLRVVVADCAEQVQGLFSLRPRVVSKAALGLGPEDHYELGEAFQDPDGAIVLSCGGTPNPRPPDAIYCEVGVASGVTAPGTADLLLVQGSSAVLVDYKTNRVLRSHDRQQQAYVLGVFQALPAVDFVDSRIVCPRLGVDAHPAVQYERERDVPRLRRELEEIVAKAEDPFEPGYPGDQCVFCAGNGRCPWQAASLRDIPSEAAALIPAGTWRSLLRPPDPETRGRRRALVKWLESFSAAVKEDDKAWALANPDTDLPYFTKSVSVGRASLDKTRLEEINQALSLTFQIPYGKLVSFLSPEKERLAEHLALTKGMTHKEAAGEVARVLARFVKRGAPIVSFRAEKQTRKAIPADTAESERKP